MKEESLLLLSDLQKLINQVVLIDYIIIILGGRTMNIKKILKPVLSIVLALVLGAAVIAMVGENPLSVYRSMLLGAFGSKMSIQKDSCWKPARIIWSLQMKN